MNHKQSHRLGPAHGFSLRIRCQRRRRRPPAWHLPAAMRPHELWAYDFVHDRCRNGPVLKCLVVVDESTGWCLAIEVDGRINSSRVVAVLERLIRSDGVPCDLRRANGPEFAAKAMKAWLSSTGIGTAYLELGKPWQNGAIERVIGKGRDEGLHREWCHHCMEARLIIEPYRREDNEERPHRSLEYRTSAEVHAGIIAPLTTQSHEARHDSQRSAGLTFPVVR